MKKIDLFKPLFLLFSLVVGSPNSWAQTSFSPVDGIFDFVNAGSANPIYDYGSGMTVSDIYTTTSKTWTSGNVTLVTSCNEYANGYRWFPNDKTLRLYNGSKAVVSVSEDYVITKVVMTGGNFLATNNPEPNEVTLESRIWTGAAQSVTFSATATHDLYIKSITVTYTAQPHPITPEKTYTTFVTPYALDFTSTDKLTVYIATGATSSEVTMESVDKVPAGTPVVLKATETGSPIGVTIVAKGDDVSANKLKAGSGTPIGGPSIWDYILSDGMFYHASFGILSEGKCYLHLDSAPAAASNALTMDFGDVTGIKTMSGVRSLKADGWYTVDGHRLQGEPTQKGIYIINGRKVVIK